VDEEGFERLVAAVRLCFGIQSPVVLRDACGLEAREAEELAEWAAFTVLRTSLGEGESPVRWSSGRRQFTLSSGATRFALGSRRFL
jgi:hypothetical protein